MTIRVKSSNYVLRFVANAKWGLNQSYIIAGRREERGRGRKRREWEGEEDDVPHLAKKDREEEWEEENVVPHLAKEETRRGERERVGGMETKRKREEGREEEERLREDGRMETQRKRKGVREGEER